jgi:hypothetical protein
MTKISLVVDVFVAVTHFAATDLMLGEEIQMTDVANRVI